MSLDIESADWRNVSDDQARFLRAVRDEPWTFDGQVKRLKLRTARVSRWFRRPEFRRRLARGIKHVRHQRELDLEMGANIATRVLQGIALGERAAPKSDQVRRACADLIRLAHM